MNSYQYTQAQYYQNQYEKQHEKQYDQYPAQSAPNRAPNQPYNSMQERPNLYREDPPNVYRNDNQNLRDNNLRDNNLRDNNLRDNNLRDNNLRDNNLRDNQNLQSQDARYFDDRMGIAAKMGGLSINDTQHYGAQQRGNQNLKPRDLSANSLPRRPSAHAGPMADSPQRIPNQGMSRGMSGPGMPTQGPGVSSQMPGPGMPGIPRMSSQMQGPGISSQMQGPGMPQGMPGMPGMPNQGVSQMPNQGVSSQMQGIPQRAQGVQRNYYNQRGSVSYGARGTPGRRLDLSQIPSVVAIREQNQKIFAEKPYVPSTENLPPLPSTRYTCVDEGICSPRFMRLTTYSFPTSKDMVSHSGISLGVILTPLAETSFSENPVPVVNCGPKGPIRCNRCKAYVNPHFVFIDGGRKFLCNICSFEGITPEDQFMNLDMYGYRLDRATRPELCLGSYEFAVSFDSFSKIPAPGVYVIAIDVTWYSIQNGVAKSALKGIKDFLYNPKSPGLPKGCKIAIMTYDKSVHFYKLLPNMAQPQMTVVAGTDTFNPFHEGFLADPIESKTVLENLLDNIHVYFKNTRVAEPAMGLVAQVVLKSIKNIGGKFIIFQTMIPTYGQGTLSNRNDPTILGTDKEKFLYRAKDTFWTKLGAEFCKAGISVDIFAFSNQYLDMATTGSLASITGGEIHYYPNFRGTTDGITVASDVKSLLERIFGYNAHIKVRVSSGIKVDKYHGNFLCLGGSEVLMGGIDPTKSIGITFKHEEVLNERMRSHIQAVTLYVTADGQGRLRIHNLMVKNTSNMAEVFRFSCVDSIAGLYFRMAARLAVDQGLKPARNLLIENVTKILLAYRKGSTSSMTVGYLLLPDTFMAYPIYVLSLLKSKAFSECADITVDQRMVAIFSILSMTPERASALMYPFIYSLTDILDNQQVGLASADGSVLLPSMVRASSHWLKYDKTYLLDDGDSLVILVTKNVDQELLKSAFGSANPKFSDNNLPVLDNQISQRMRNIIDYIRFERGKNLPLHVITHLSDPIRELKFSNCLVEDEGLGNMAYSEFICSLYVKIQDKVYD